MTDNRSNQVVGWVCIFVKRFHCPDVRRWFLLLVFVALLLGASAPELSAQSGYLLSIGVPTFTTQLPVENGFVNLSNGDLHIEIPLGFYPERAGRPVSLSFVYDSAIWQVVSSSWQPTNVPNAQGGWKLFDTMYGGAINSDSNCSFDGYGGGGCTYDNFSWTAADGTQRFFEAETWYSCDDYYNCDYSADDYEHATDGSGYFLHAFYNGSAWATAPDGNQNSLYEDPNGN
jgi:hypothetical protein